MSALAPASIAAQDCALFLWATVPMLPQALLAMAAWGFDYRSHVIWAKDRLRRRQERPEDGPMSKSDGFSQHGNCSLVPMLGTM
jgi:hypothetical protein